LSILDCRLKIKTGDVWVQSPAKADSSAFAALSCRNNKFSWTEKFFWNDNFVWEVPRFFPCSSYCGYVYTVDFIGVTTPLRELALDTTPFRILEIILSIGFAIAFLYVLGRVWPPSKRSPHNDVVGPSAGVIGTTYAVILAFMLSGVWSSYQVAEATAEQEANSLVTLFRLAQGLPGDTKDRVRRLAHDYASVMIHSEWRAMEHEQRSEDAQRIVADLWKMLESVQPQSASEQIALDRTLAELSAMTEHRRLRLLQSRTNLPPILWAVLLAGGIVCVTSICLFGVDNFNLHVAQVFAVTFLLSLTLVAIADVDRPYQGTVHVEPTGFTFALETFDRTP
jgi:hypothetical protein